MMSKNLICLFAILYCLNIYGQGYTIQITNGAVTASALNTTTGVLYLGGNFNAINASVTGGFAAISQNNAMPLNGWPKIDGEVFAIAEDGLGGWYIGGHFDSVGGLSRNNLAHIDNNGNVVDWIPTVDGTVSSIAINSNIVYIGGIFRIVGNQNRSNIAAIHAFTGNVLEWNPFATTLPEYDSNISSIAIKNNSAYVAGNFTTISGVARNYLAEIDLITGSVTGWNPNPNYGVQAIAISGNIIYVGGGFYTIAGSTRSRIAAFDATNGSLTGWNPYVYNSVRTIATKDNIVYVGGDFLTIAGQPRNYIAALDAVTGSVTGWNPNANFVISSLAINGNTAYASGFFSSIGNTPRNYLAAIDLTTGNTTDWNPNVNNYVYALAADANGVFAGGSFSTIGGEPRGGLAAVDAATGIANDWAPTANGEIRTLAVSSNEVYVGGNFTSISGIGRNNIAVIDAITGDVKSWNPNADGIVSTIALVDNTIYIGGDFASVSGFAHSRIAALDATTENVKNWNPSANATILSIATRGNKLYAGGSFTTVNGIVRNRIVELDRLTGSVTGWNANANNNVRTIATQNDRVYVGGDFTSIGGQSRNYIAALDTTIGAANNWDPNASDPVYSIAVEDDKVFVGGLFINIGKFNRLFFAILESTSANSIPNNLLFPSYVTSLVVNNDTIFAGGYFTNLIIFPDGNEAVNWKDYNSSYVTRLDINKLIYKFNPVSYPASVTKCVGSNVKFTITNPGSNFNWYKDETIVGTDSVLNLTNISASKGGDYYCIVTIDGLGIFTSTGSSLTVKSLPTITLNHNSLTICGGQSVLLSASGANTYSWSNGIQQNVAFVPLVSTIYSVAGTDLNGCTNSSVASISVKPIPTITDFSSFNICQTISAVNLSALPTGGTFTGNGVLNNLFITSTVGVGNSSLSYSVTANGCTSLKTVTASIINCTAAPSVPGIAIIINGNTTIIGLTTITSNISIIDGNTITGITSFIGSNTSTVQTLVGIGSTLLGINNATALAMRSTDWQVYPNPSSGGFTISANVDDLKTFYAVFQIEIFNTMGVHVATVSLGEYILPKGLYLLKARGILQKLLIE